MSTSQDLQVSFGLHSFKIVGFKLNELPKDYDEQNMGYKFQFRQELNEEEGIFSIYLKVSAQEGEDAKEVIASIETRTSFNVSDIDKMIEGDNINVPISLGTTLLSISLSTTRGALAAKTEGHFLENHLLPLVNPQIMYEEFLKKSK